MPSCGGVSGIIAQFDVLLIPLVILALTYAFSLGGQTVLLTSIAMYAAVWHRGRQSLGVARFYQRGMGGPVSQTHEVLFRGAIYLPMLAAVLAYTQLAPEEYEGEPYVALKRRSRNNLDRGPGHGALGNRLFCLDVPAEPRRRGDVHARPN